MSSSSESDVIVVVLGSVVCGRTIGVICPMLPVGQLKRAGQSATLGDEACTTASGMEWDSTARLPEAWVVGL